MARITESLRKVRRSVHRVGRCLVRRGAALDEPSFAAAMSYQTRFRRALIDHAGLSIEDAINPKINGFFLAEQLGVAQPYRHTSGAALRDVRLQPKTVIKPLSATASWGAYYIFSPDRIESIRDGRVLASYSALTGELEKLLKTSHINRDAWVVEELVIGPDGRPARDCKVYTFYGRAVLALEVARLGRSQEYCWWSRDGKRVNTGKYKSQAGPGGTPENSTYELAEAMSLALPAPFVRVDFLSSRRGPIFSEFTPRPGRYDGFNRAWDRILGEEFVSASARLFYDMREGKAFPEFERMVGRK